MSAQPPRIRLYLDITDVGERGFEVAITVEGPDNRATYLAPTITDAFWHIRDYAARLLWGPRLPPETRDHIGEATEKVGTDEKPPG